MLYFISGGTSNSSQVIRMLCYIVRRTVSTKLYTGTAETKSDRGNITLLDWKTEYSIMSMSLIVCDETIESKVDRGIEQSTVLLFSSVNLLSTVHMKLPVVEFVHVMYRNNDQILREMLTRWKRAGCCYWESVALAVVEGHCTWWKLCGKWCLWWSLCTVYNLLECLDRVTVGDSGCVLVWCLSRAN